MQTLPPIRPASLRFLPHLLLPSTGDNLLGSLATPSTVTLHRSLPHLSINLITSPRDFLPSATICLAVTCSSQSLFPLALSWKSVQFSVFLLKDCLEKIPVTLWEEDTLLVSFLPPCSGTYKVVAVLGGCHIQGSPLLVPVSEGGQVLTRLGLDVRKEVLGNNKEDIDELSPFKNDRLYIRKLKAITNRDIFQFTEEYSGSKLGTEDIVCLKEEPRVGTAGQEEQLTQQINREDVVAKSQDNTDPDVHQGDVSILQTAADTEFVISPVVRKNAASAINIFKSTVSSTLEFNKKRNDAESSLMRREKEAEIMDKDYPVKYSKAGEQGHVYKGEEVLARKSPANSNFDKNDLKEKQIRETYWPIVNMEKRMKDKSKRRKAELQLNSHLRQELKTRELTSQLPKVMAVIEKQQKIKDIKWELVKVADLERMVAGGSSVDSKAQDIIRSKGRLQQSLVELQRETGNMT